MFISSELCADERVSCSLALGAGQACLCAHVHYTCMGMSLQRGCPLFASKILAQLSLPLLQPPSRTWLMGIDLEPFKALQQNKGEGRGRELFPVRPGEK